VIVIDEELFVPDVNVRPDVEPKTTLPWATEIVRESDDPEAAESAMPIEPEKVNELFSFKAAVGGAVMLGAE
jgi:hypothetical protein